MKILLTARWPVGGIRTFLRYVYTHPILSNHRFELVCPDEEGFGEFAGRMFDRERFTTHFCGSGAADLRRAIRTRLREGRPDLMHSHGYSAGSMAELARLGTGVPHLLTIHDMILPGTFSGWRGELKRRGLQLLLGRMRRIHAVSEDNARNLREHMPALRPERIRPILHGVDAAMFRDAEPLDVHAETGLPPETILIGFFGRFMAPKGFRTLVDAIRHLRQTQCVDRPLKVLTFGWGGFIREDYDHLTELGLADDFMQLPATDEPARWMKGMDVVAMPSRWEACGLLAMEAMCAGVPLVGSTCMGLREVIADTPAIGIEPGDGPALAQALLDQASDTAKAAARDFQPEAVRRFDIERPVREILSLYEDVAACAA